LCGTYDDIYKSIKSECVSIFLFDEAAAAIADLLDKVVLPLFVQQLPPELDNDSKFLRLGENDE